MKPYLRWFMWLLVSLAIFPVVSLIDLRPRTIQGGILFALACCIPPIAAVIVGLGIVIAFFQLLRAQYVLLRALRGRPFPQRAEEAARRRAFYCGEEIRLEKDGTPCSVRLIKWS